MMVVLAVVAASLLIVEYVFMHRPLPTLILPTYVTYGYLYCNNDVVIPNGSMIVLYYHPHGDVEVNSITIYVVFPASIINEVLSLYSRLPNSSGVMVMGVYVNGRLIAVNINYSSPIESLMGTLGFWQHLPIKAVETTYYVNFPTINLKPNDTITIIIYSTIPYTLPSCKINNETEEGELMVENHWIGLFGLMNATPTAEQLYEEGKYITEEPVIYIINVSKPIEGLPQELPMGARPFLTGIAPSYAIAQNIPVTNNK
ncbi:hypothetical protein [Caldivirga sp. UBA161]|uniref:hypothetical protein n=1 Tax=Caldivirga sp. UBA161 TaxID=1915569 RepID=UPI0025BD4E4A|nr:hypothetical protein [Caldivirga sp. UBA161]